MYRPSSALLIAAVLLGSPSTASAGMSSFGPDSLIIYGLWDGIGPWARPLTRAPAHEHTRSRAMEIRQSDRWVVWVRGRWHAGHWTRYPGTSHTSWHRPAFGTHPVGMHVYGMNMTGYSQARVARSVFFPSPNSDGGHLYVRHRAASLPLLRRYGGADLEARYGRGFDARLERSYLLFTSGGTRAPAARRGFSRAAARPIEVAHGAGAP